MSERDRADRDHWLDRARSDLAAARILAAAIEVTPRVAAGLAHQAAEKALKAAIASLGVDPPRSHDLVALAHRVVATMPLAATDAQLRVLTDAHGKSRYPEPGDLVYDRDEVAMLVELAASVVLDVERALGQ
jgi:HEPN domain-containing protein